MSSDHDNRGPFVQNTGGPGLLRRLLGGGSNDPSAPHPYTERSTAEMHGREALEPPRRSSPLEPPRTRTRERGLLLQLLSWLFRAFGWRIVIAGVVAVIALANAIGNGFDANQIQTVTEDITTQFESTPSVTDPAVPTPVPEDLTASSFRATITSVRDDTVVLDAGGTTFSWKVGSPGVYAALTRNIGEETLVNWELRDTEIYVVGVDGPNATMAPPEDPATS